MANDNSFYIISFNDIRSCSGNWSKKFKKTYSLQFYWPYGVCFSRFSCWCSVCRHLCSVSSVVSYLVSGLQCCAQCLVFVLSVLTAQAHCLASTFQREMASLSPLVLNVLFLCVRFDLSVGQYLVRLPNSQGSGRGT